MRYFFLLDFQAMVLALFLGLTAVILVYLAFGGYPRRRPEGPTKGAAPWSATQITHGEEGQGNPVPVLLVVIYAGIMVAAWGYMMVIGIRGAAF
jgi:hypothetical protein